MVRERQTEVLVVGAGPVGLFAAVTLADLGVEVEVVDEAWRPSTHGYALALHPRSLELLGAVGLADGLVASGQRVDTVAFYDRSGRRAELDLGRLTARFPFAVALPQRELERTLQERLAARKVEVRWNHRVSAVAVEGDRAVATVDRLDRVSGGYPVATTSEVVVASSTVRAVFVLGADGSRSLVRSRLGSAVERPGEAGLFGVFELRAEFAPSHEMRVVVDDDTVSGLWPLGDRRWRWSFQLRDAVQLPRRRPGESRAAVRIGGAAFPGLAAERLAELLAERAPWFDAAVEEVFWSLAVGFERSLATPLGQGPLWLAGDAAHTMLPLGMQSMNAGLEEAHRLAFAMADHLRGRVAGRTFGFDPQQRADELRVLLGAADRVDAEAAADPWVARHAGRLVECTPAGGDALDQLLAQLGLKRSRPG